MKDKEMSDLILELQPVIDKYNEKAELHVTLFELETTMALLYFYRKNVDFVILETGLGGLSDCTNIITKPIVSIITSIGYDHMKLLGDTLPKIAHQKAGIIKANSNTVIFEQEEEINQVFIDECEKKNNKLHMICKTDITNYNYDESYQYFDYKDMKNLAINLKGKVQTKNAAICIETIQILKEQGYKIHDNSIREGLKDVVHKGRIEQINTNPDIIYDGAHNEPAVKNLLEMVGMYYNKKKRVYIISILARKDYNTMLKLLSKDKDATFIMTSGNGNDKYVKKEELYDYMKEYVKSDRIYKKDLQTAIKELKKDENEVNFVIGSFYTYGTVIDALNKKEE